VDGDNGDWDNYDDGQWDEKCGKFNRDSSSNKVGHSSNPKYFSFFAKILDHDTDDKLCIIMYLTAGGGSKSLRVDYDKKTFVFDSIGKALKNGKKLSNGDSVEFNRWDHYYIEFNGTEDDLYLGAREYDGKGWGFYGYMQNVRTFTEKLTDEQINDLKKEQKGVPTDAYFIEPNIKISTALTKDDDPVDPDDFNDEELDSWKIDTDNDVKEHTYKKVSDYSGNKFQRKVTGDENGNITYLKTNMWKDA